MGFVIVQEEEAVVRRLSAIAFLVLGTLTIVAGTRPAHSQQHINYPWCTSGAMQEYGAVNCGFSTFEQCLATRAWKRPIVWTEPILRATGWLNRRSRPEVEAHQKLLALM